MAQDDIDVVIIWVDGSDRNWLQKKNSYINQLDKRLLDVDLSISRYRNWDNLQYILRGIENFMPWVRKVHFVTEGHVPTWLNKSCNKLNIVRHKDYVPDKYLPTFSSHAIEMNLHRIKGLANKFIYFNDDMFVTRPIGREIFFKNGLPRDEALLNRITAKSYDDVMSHIGLNNLGIINDNFSKKEIIFKRPFQWFSLRYNVSDVLRTVMLLPYPMIPGFYWHHLPSAYKKVDFEKVWKNAHDSVDSALIDKFKTKNKVNQYLVKSWRVATGDFYPSNVRRGNQVYFGISNSLDEIAAAIKNQKYNLICLNDSNDEDNFEESKRIINDAFQSILSSKSSFEI